MVCWPFGRVRMCLRRRGRRPNRGQWWFAGPLAGRGYVPAGGVEGLVEDIDGSLSPFPSEDVSPAGAGGLVEDINSPMILWPSEDVSLTEGQEEKAFLCPLLVGP